MVSFEGNLISFLEDAWDARFRISCKVESPTNENGSLFRTRNLDRVSSNTSREKCSAGRLAAFAKIPSMPPFLRGKVPSLSTLLVTWCRFLRCAIILVVDAFTIEYHCLHPEYKQKMSISSFFVDGFMATRFSAQPRVNTQLRALRDLLADN